MLTPHQKKLLKAKAHSLKPVVITGQNGLTVSVLNEIDLALNHHELIKVRLRAALREDRHAMMEEICSELHAELIQSIGHVVTLFRESPDKIRG